MDFVPLFKQVDVRFGQMMMMMMIIMMLLLIKMISPMLIFTPRADMELQTEDSNEVAVAEDWTDRSSQLGNVVRVFVDEDEDNNEDEDGVLDGGGENDDCETDTVAIL